MIYLITVVILQVSLALAKVRFDSFALYHVVPQDESQLKHLQNLAGRDGIDIWTEPSNVGKTVDVLVSPDQRKYFTDFFQGRSNIEIVSDNLQRLIENERIGTYNQSIGMTFDAYYNLDDIYEWHKHLVDSNPGVVTEIVGGRTYEGRNISGIKISHGSGRRAIFLEGGIHSREWIAIATVNFIANELLYSDDEETKLAAQNYDWYIFPVVNPDGYVHSHDVNRFWRKNTRPVGSGILSAVGVDINRNWNSNWMVAGTSSLPASNSYGGTGPFSEIESRTFSEYITSMAPDIEMYLSFHSYSQLLLLPYGNSTEHYDNYSDVVVIGRRAMGALAVRYNTQYTTGNIAEAIYLATGGSIDWVKEKLRVPIALCYELRDRGQYGFLLPADQIIPTGEETVDSLLALIREAKRFGYFS